MSVHAKLLEAQKKVAAVAKTGHNQHFNYNFFEEREVLKVAREALTDAGLAFIYSVEDVRDREVTTSSGREELLTDAHMLCTIFDAESGDEVSGRAVGRGQDGQDKGVNKAIVAGLKYWLLKTLMIPTDDDIESDENTNPSGNHPRRQARPAPSNGAPKATSASDGEIACPACGGPMWDNRETKKGKQPDFKCKDKAGCDHAVWIDGLSKEVDKLMNEAIEIGAITNEQAQPVAEAVITSDGPLLMKSKTRLEAAIARKQADDPSGVAEKTNAKVMAAEEAATADLPF